jgi:hypothetical protein
MTLKEMVERECRFFGAINMDGTIDDDVVIYINHDMLQRVKREITSTKDGLYIENTRVLIDHRLGGNMVQISLV